jgi:heme/copper-type cytochrome/quinol oxidase subunit 1
VDRLFYLSTYFGSRSSSVYRIVAGLGIASEVIATNARANLWLQSDDYVHYFFSTIVWHHVFVSGMNPFWVSIYFTTLLIAIPAVKALIL